MEETYLADMIQAIQTHSADYCQSSHKILYEDTGIIRDSTRKDSAVGTMEQVIDVLYFRYITGKFYSAKIVRENGILFDERLICGEDNSFNFDYFPHAKKCVIIPDAGYVYRRCSGSVTSQSVKPDKKKHMYEHIIRFFNCFDSRFILEKYRNNYHIAHCMIDPYLAEVINAVLEKNAPDFQRLITDHVGDMLLQNYSYTEAQRKSIGCVAEEKVSWYRKAVG